MSAPDPDPTVPRAPFPHRGPDALRGPIGGASAGARASHPSKVSA
jgi:hypothetical protein